ncbi:ribonuclease Z [Xylanibacillus composti]|uniref:MBL fold hydrolase n=1 Tax=Xylanibacillus composti TaxID=1572762 RepID=A0A8J4M1X6_9BACL|nr:MBL fold metallo-hydrolase [Xylanibacillus composti]MDT9724289.1 ribonuclease Z [Xylanibacillus composti]GIQ69285.1 MBL fold hydrolase [Xylanibacillus composti]
MEFRLQMIGTGSAFAKKYYNNNALLMCQDRSLLIDCGITAPMALHEAGRAFQQLDGILVTHLHADHIGGLEEAAFVTKFSGGRKLRLFVPKPLIDPLWEHSLKAGLEDSQFGQDLSGYFDVVPLYEGEEQELLPGIAVEILKTDHIPNKDSYSLLLNGNFFYSADVKFNAELIISMIEEKGCGTVLHDCQLEGRPTVHATLDELLSLPAYVQEKIMLMHYGDNMEDYRDRIGSMSFIRQRAIYHIEKTGRIRALSD